MSHTAVMLHNDAEDVTRVERLLAALRLPLLRCEQVDELELCLETCRQCLVLLNLEAKGVDNALLRRVSKACDQVHIIGISKRPYHPELEQALRSHLLTVVAHPINDEELGLCLRGVLES
ncbi:hypothetical protein [Desulfonatronum thioautotrophicum]|uniref:hypothetical protein n=1 Tax=Desulfonatronum thioautotrophicum TaxID=617001 RepID=UPI0005EB094A|nr:hypothetical protein [Desulfonatronum thioautotrophicum]